MLRKFFNYIRRKPRTVRNRYAMGFATTFTGVLAIFWVTNSSTFDFTAKDISQNENKEVSTFSTITKQAKEQLANLRSSISEETNDVNVDVVENENEEDQSVQIQQNPTAIVLSAEDLEIIDKKDQGTTSVATSSSANSSYREVIIATTSAKIPDSNEPE